MKNKNRKLKSKIKNAILKTITLLATIVLIVSISCLDSENANIFYIGIFVSSIWLSLFAYVNGYLSIGRKAKNEY